MMSLFKVLFKNLNLYRTNKRFRRVQIVTAALQAFTHGTNDAQKSMGIITMALIAAGYLIWTMMYQCGFVLLVQSQWD